jgi:hypothetical protein
MAWVDTLLSWDWKTIASTFAAAGIGSAIMQCIVTVHLDSRKQKKAAKSLAVKLAVLLESHTARYTEFIEDNSNAQPIDYDHEYPDWDTELPLLPTLPDDPEGWHGLNVKLNSRCVGVVNTITAGQRSINSCIEYAQQVLGETLTIEAAEIGINMWKLATDLRKVYRLGKPSLDRAYVAELEDWRDRALAEKYPDRAKGLWHYQVSQWANRSNQWAGTER